jgi:hypothetical protein
MEVELPPEDGGMPLDDSQANMPEFGDNLALMMTEEELIKIANSLIEAYEGDLRSRTEWEQSYVKGLDLLGMSSEERSDPWPGACGVFHPLLTEAVVRFQSQAITEIFPAAGPARTKIQGPVTPQKADQALRVEEEINYLLTERMTEYRGETEQLLFRLPLVGSVFRKVYYDAPEERPAAIMVPAEDFVINYGASDLRSAERYTHVMRRTKNELKKLMASGLYRDVDLQEPTMILSDIDAKHDKLSGRRPTLDTDNRFTPLELHVDYDLEGADLMVQADGIARPYIITVEKSSNKVLAIYRNWEEDDDGQKKKIHFSHYQYMPGMGFYGFGLVHLVGGLAKSATSVLRQLVDSGTLSNLQAGFKTRGMRVKNEQDPISPGEWRDVDLVSGKLSDNILPLPVKEPSATLYNLLGTLVDEGRRIASIADLDVGDMNTQAPVGTTLALMERSMKIMSAVHSRLHAALKDELKLIAGIVGNMMPPNYDWDVDEEFSRADDFSDGSRVQIIPVSDPNSATMAQRVVQYQAVLQMAQMDPSIYDVKLLHRKGLEAFQVKDAEELIPMDDELQPKDPVSENMGFLTGVATKAFQPQDHKAHMKTHMSFIMDPKIAEMVGQSPNAEMIRSTIESHIGEHLAFDYRQRIEAELGTPLPPIDEPLDPEIENQLSYLVADASNRVLYKAQNEAAQKKAEELAVDPLFQLEVSKQKLAEKEFEHKKLLELMNLKLELNKIESNESIEGMKLAVDLAISDAEIAGSLEETVIKAGADITKTIAGAKASATARRISSGGSK